VNPEHSGRASPDPATPDPASPDPASPDPASPGAASSCPAPTDSVLMVVEQLRRRVPGGAGTYAAGLITGLRRLIDAGEQVPPVTLFSSRQRSFGPEDGGSRQDPLAGFRMPTIESRLPAPLLTRAWDAGLIQAPAGFRTLHATSLAVPPARGVRTFVTVHDLAWRHVPFAFPRHGRKWHEHAFMKAVRKRLEVVVPSLSVADELIEAGVDPRRVNLIEPGGDHLPPPEFDAAKAVLERNGVLGPFLLSVSTLEPRKNLEALIDAYSSIRDSLPGPWPLVVVGPGGWGPAVVVREGVVLVGAVSAGELSALYATAELLAYVPLVEGFGLPPLEAMQAGTPVVASPMPSTGGVAREVDPHRIEEIARGILDVATDGGLRNELILAGRSRAAHLSWSVCARQHIDLWQSASPN
jgi:glycosyltransferase involved in cell wall biosynthesis